LFFFAESIYERIYEHPNTHSSPPSPHTYYTQTHTHIHTEFPLSFPSILSGFPFTLHTLHTHILSVYNWTFIFDFEFILYRGEFPCIQAILFKSPLKGVLSLSILPTHSSSIFISNVKRTAVERAQRKENAVAVL
jgi:hypothetical protein